MEVPFYYSFKEFKENYETDLKKWLEVYTEGYEKYFLECLKNVYSRYFVDILGVVNSDCVNLPIEIVTERGGGNLQGISIDEFVKLIDKRLNWYIEHNYRKRCDEEIIDKTIFNNSVYNDNLVWNNYYYDYREKYYDGYKLNYYEYLKVKDFIEIEDYYNGYFFGYKLKFNHIKYNNFRISLPLIYNFIQEKLNAETGIKTSTPPPDEVEPITLPENIDKIQINGNYQLLAFLFRELIEKGYITAPIHNGKPSYKRTAEMLLKHFEFTNKEKQPSVENLTNYIKNNTYSMQKQSLFKIPSIKTAND